MHLDISRDNFDEKNHLLRVPHEQGRVLLDAALNEQTAILLHRLRTLAGDIFGAHWGPAPSKAYSSKSAIEVGVGEPKEPNSRVEAYSQPGFKITRDQDQFTISAGRYYVNGLLCECEATNLTGTKGPSAIKFFDQPDYPVIDDAIVVPALVYIDVWERVISEFTHAELIDTGLESIPGPSRTKLVWQVRTLTKNLPDENKLKAFNETLDPSLGVSLLRQLIDPNNQSVSTGALRAMPAHGVLERSADGELPDHCGDSDSFESYRGPENQLYRVEIHRGGSEFQAGKSDPESGNYATFKWSRDNGSICFPIKQWPSDLVEEQTDFTVTLTHSGYDSRTQLKLNDWVEYVDEITVLSPAEAEWVPRVPRLFQVVAIDPFEPTEIKLRARTGSDANLPKASKNIERRAFLRRWDQRPDLDAKKDGPLLSATSPFQANDNALVVMTPAYEEGGIKAVPKDEWLNLEDGVQIQFSPGNYKRGDYWLIPARCSSKGVLWKLDKYQQPEFLPARNTAHYYAPLAFIPKLGPELDCRRVVTIADDGAVKIKIPV